MTNGGPAWTWRCRLVKCCLQIFWENDPLLNASLFPYAGAEYPANSQLAVLQHTFSISPRMVNIARLGFSRNLAFHRGQPTPSATLANQLGISNTYDPSSYPQVNPLGYTSFGTTVGRIGNTDDNYQLDESVNYLRGTHAFQFGGGIRYHRTLQLNNNGDAHGGLDFLGNFTSQLVQTGPGQYGAVPNTGNSFADFLLGLPNDGTTQGLPPIWYRYTQWMPYFQDTWKVTRNFTLNYGISWYYSNPPNPQGAVRNQVAALNLSTGLLEYAASGRSARSCSILSAIPSRHDLALPGSRRS